MNKLTISGRTLLKHCPSSKSVAIGERTLIERANGLSDYANYQTMIAELIQAGYLQYENGKIKRTLQGDNALKQVQS